MCNLLIKIFKPVVFYKSSTGEIRRIPILIKSRNHYYLERIGWVPKNDRSVKAERWFRKNI